MSVIAPRHDDVRRPAPIDADRAVAVVCITVALFTLGAVGLTAATGSLWPLLTAVTIIVVALGHLGVTTFIALDDAAHRR